MREAGCVMRVERLLEKTVRTPVIYQCLSHRHNELALSSCCSVGRPLLPETDPLTSVYRRSTILTLPPYPVRRAQRIDFGDIFGFERTVCEELGVSFC
ncbi:hypothetical protein J6590_073382 [Homalodisca vitripennis]|nr:hypothetical protein J6590_073382 [Homalodisca vitripennis]